MIRISIQYTVNKHKHEEYSCELPFADSPLLDRVGDDVGVFSNNSSILVSEVLLRHFELWFVVEVCFHLPLDVLRWSERLVLPKLCMCVLQSAHLQLPSISKRVSYHPFKLISKTIPVEM